MKQISVPAASSVHENISKDTVNFTKVEDQTNHSTGMFTNYRFGIFDVTLAHRSSFDLRRS